MTLKTKFVVPLLPSLCETLLMVIEGNGSSSLMVNVAVPVPMVVPPVGLLRVRLTVSFGSSSASSLRVTLKLWLVTPSAKTSVPLVAL